MKRAGGRRIKRAILIDMHSVKVCTAAMVDRFGKIELISDYMRKKKLELEEYNIEREIEASSVNSRRLTNIGTFRAYLEAYLANHPQLKGEMTYLVRHLEPTKFGVPIEIYAFCSDTTWKEFEAVQADIFDHLLSILSAFELRAFQDITNSDAHSSEDLSHQKTRSIHADIS